MGLSADNSFVEHRVAIGPDPALVSAVHVVIPGGFSQTVRAIPALRHLRSLYLAAHISAYVPDAAHGLASACPYIDTCQVVGTRALLGGRLGEAARDNVEVVVFLGDPDQEHDARALKTFADISTRKRQRCIATYRADSAPSVFDVHPVWQPRMGHTQRMLRLVWLLGGSHTPPALALWPSLVDRNGAAELLAGNRLPVATMHCGSPVTQRGVQGSPEAVQTETQRMATYSRIIDSVARLGFQVVVVGDGAEQASMADVRAACDREFLDLVGRASVGVLTGIVERSAVFIGVDDGPAALAEACGVPAVIFGAHDTVDRTHSSRRVVHIDVDPLRHEESVLAQVTCHSQAARIAWQITQQQ